MKTCTLCTTEKPFSEFGFRSKAKGTYQSWCKSCVKHRDKQKWDSDPNRRSSKYEKQKDLRTRNRRHVWDYFSSHPCVECGNNDPRVLEFDHLDPKTKTANISDMVKTSSIEKINKEIEKCRVLCANCHRIHTFDQQGWQTFNDS